VDQKRIRKIRRRIEDRLRNADARVIVHAAILLGVDEELSLHRERVPGNISREYTARRRYGDVEVEIDAWCVVCHDWHPYQASVWEEPFHRKGIYVPPDPGGRVHTNNIFCWCDGCQNWHHHKSPLWEEEGHRKGAIPLPDREKICKIRRRIEDRLRKSRATFIMRAALLLGVNIG
jgi:hypothetical protein